MEKRFVDVEAGYTELPSSTQPPIEHGIDVARVWRIATIFILAFFTVALLWPSPLQFDVLSTELVSISWGEKQESNGLGLELNMIFKVQFRVRNNNVFGGSFDRILVKLGYRGDEFGSVDIEAGRIPPFTDLRLEAEVNLKGVKVLKHAGELLIDVVNGRLPLETKTDFAGNFQFLFFNVPVQRKLDCQTVVNPKTHEILDHFCW